LNEEKLDINLRDRAVAVGGSVDDQFSEYQSNGIA
jgi:hypothetical protein